MADPMVSPYKIYPAIAEYVYFKDGKFFKLDYMGDFDVNSGNPAVEAELAISDEGQVVSEVDEGYVLAPDDWIEWYQAMAVQVNGSEEITWVTAIAVESSYKKALWVPRDVCVIDDTEGKIAMSTGDQGGLFAVDINHANRAIRAITGGYEDVTINFSKPPLTVAEILEVFEPNFIGGLPEDRFYNRGGVYYLTNNVIPGSRRAVGVQFKNMFDPSQVNTYTVEQIGLLAYANNFTDSSSVSEDEDFQALTINDISDLLDQKLEALSLISPPECPSGDLFSSIGSQMTTLQNSMEILSTNITSLSSSIATLLEDSDIISLASSQFSMAVRDLPTQSYLNDIFDRLARLAPMITDLRSSLDQVYSNVGQINESSMDALERINSATDTVANSMDSYLRTMATTNNRLASVDESIVQLLSSLTNLLALVKQFTENKMASVDLFNALMERLDPLITQILPLISSLSALTVSKTASNQIELVESQDGTKKNRETLGNILSFAGDLSNGLLSELLRRGR